MKYFDYKTQRSLANFELQECLKNYKLLLSNKHTRHISDLDAKIENKMQIDLTE